MSEKNNKDDRYGKLPEVEISTKKYDEPEDLSVQKSTPGEAVATKNKFVLWIENFFYHYKWHTAAVAFILIVAIVCTVTMCGRKKADVMIVYAGNGEIFTNSNGGDTNTHDILLKSLERVGRESGMSVFLNSYWWLSNNEIEARNNDDDPNNDISSAQDTNIYSGFQEFDHLMTLGGSSQYYIWFVSPDLYEYYTETIIRSGGNVEQLFTNLDYLEGYNSDIQYYTAAECSTESLRNADLANTAIKLSSLGVYSKEFKDLLPDDTLVVLRAPRGLGLLKTKTAFNKSSDYLVGMVKIK